MPPYSDCIIILTGRNSLVEETCNGLSSPKKVPRLIMFPAQPAAVVTNQQDNGPVILVITEMCGLKSENANSHPLPPPPSLPLPLSSDSLGAPALLHLHRCSPRRLSLSQLFQDELLLLYQGELVRSKGGREEGLEWSNPITKLLAMRLFV